MLKIAKQRLHLLIGVSGVAVALFVGLFLHAAPANAGTFGFCGNVQLPGGGFCQTGNFVSTYQAFGWGDQHSVCVSLRPLAFTQACSGGPTQGVYSGQISQQFVQPVITNNAAGANFVHGVYFTH